MGITPRQVLRAFAHDGPLRRKGALKLLGDAGTPVSAREVKVADRLVSFMLGAPVHAPLTDALLRRVDVPAVEIGRAAARDRLAGLLRQAPQVPVFVVGPDAASVIAAALDSAGARRRHPHPAERLTSS